MEITMPQGDGGLRTINQFALVGYISGSLAVFLDLLRLELAPACNPRAHVTVVPPLPIDHDLKEVEGIIEEATQSFPPFKVELGEIEIFPVSNVIYLSLRHGERELRHLHAKLNRGPLADVGPFCYHPHITIAQGLEPGSVAGLSRIARERWAQYGGPREFPVEILSSYRMLLRRCGSMLSNSR